ncbi:MAG: sensor signal transduction histidine kinase [Bryobacterales bacterium]|nr:sensor signal transduction histidine kinase [Bryobacterales bacterium]
MTDDTGPSIRELFELMIARLNEFAIVLADRQGRYLTWHPGVEQLFGYSEQEFVGQKTDMLLPRNEQLGETGQQTLKDTSERGRTTRTRPMLTKSGRMLMVEDVTIALRSPSGDLLGFGKVLREVANETHAQNGLTALARALDQSAVIVRQWDGTVEHWTAGCERLYGWSAEEATGKALHQLLRTSFPSSREHIQQQLLLSGAWKGELQQVRKDGSQVAVSADWALLTDAADEPLSVIESHADITARIAVQEQLESANAKLQIMALELERSNQELEEFARIASHDLSAPITSTRWLVELLASRHGAALDDSGRKCISQISQGLDRMGELVEAVLAHARVGTTAISSAAHTHCEDALSVAIDNLRKDIELSGAQIQYQSLPLVEVNPQALSQLFQNLISNAIKYRRQDVTPEIRIGAEWKSRMWTISVTDNGLGLEPEWFKRIFQPMQRRHGLDVAGSGIGLATCRKIVMRVGGSIWVESQVGVGSTFYCTLPGPEPEEDAVAAAALDTAGSEPEASR